MKIKYKSDLIKRLEFAKKELADTTVVMDTYKIVANGSFGKFGSKWSCLYSPKLLVQVTLTGQLALLMLIEQLHIAGIPVVSANTDGIVIKCRRSDIAKMNDVISVWEFVTSFETEATEYLALYCRDVNSYVALKRKGGVKTKGLFASSSLSKSPTSEIVTQAVINALDHGYPVEQTITECDDIRKFLTIRTVSGGCLTDGGDYIGKAVRWYYSTGMLGSLHYKKNGNRVGNSEGAMPCMVIPDSLPADIDYDRYIRAAKKTLKLIGA